MAEPPLLAGAVQLRATWALPAVALNPVGPLATVAGVAEASLDMGPSPTPLTAVTLKKYLVPLVRPVTVKVGAPEPVQEGLTPRRGPFVDVVGGDGRATGAGGAVQ